MRVFQGKCVFLADGILVSGGKLTRILQKLTRSDAKPDPFRANSVWQNIYDYDSVWFVEYGKLTRFFDI